MKTHVSFQRPSPTLANDAQPFGEDIADALIGSLKSQGLGDVVLDTLDYAYTFHAPASTRSCCVMVGLVDDGVRQWLISCDLQRGFFSRLFGKSDDSDLQTVVLAIHKFLADDDAVTSIRWYTPDAWNKNPDNAWSDSPVA